MSTILKALKRLEKNHPAQARFQTIISAAQGSERKGRRRWTLFCLTVLIIVGGLFFFTRSFQISTRGTKTPPPSVAPISQSKPDKPPNESAARLPYTAPLPETRRQAPPVYPQKPKHQAALIDTQKKSGPGDQARQTVAPEPAQPALPGSTRRDAITPPGNAASRNPALKDQNVFPAGVGSDHGPLLPNAPDVQPLNDPGIKLQAISWSSVPDERMVVINNSIIHENETVDGYRLLAIGQDSVILSKETMKGRLSFDLQEFKSTAIRPSD